jgi:hypothetical protein
MRLVRVCLYMLLVASWAAAQQDPLLPFMDTSSWPDSSGVGPVYGTISVKLNLNGTQTSPNGTINSVAAQVTRTETLGMMSQAIYFLSGTITANIPDMDGGVPCLHIVTTTVSVTY